MKKDAIQRNLAGNHQFSTHSPWLIVLALISIISLIVSITALAQVMSLKNTQAQTIQIQQLLERLMQHEEAKQFIGQSPLDIVQITNANLANLQTQIQGLDASYLGSFIIQYQNALVLYDFENDAFRGILNTQQQNNLPDDFFAKLNAHQQAQGLVDEKPIGGKLDAQTLSTLQQQFPDVYKDAQPGHYLLRYQSRLIIYNYEENRIINAVNLQ